MKYPLQYCIDGGTENDDGGAFRIPYKGRILRIIASHGGGWDHVSVSLVSRIPNWKEMCFVKDLFFDDEECVVQYHPPRSEYKNLFPYCLHLWKPHNIEFPMPPIEFV